MIPRRASVCSAVPTTTSSSFYASSAVSRRPSLFAVRGECPPGSVEYGGLGVNAFDVLWCGSSAMASNCTYADVQHSLQFLAESGLRYFRFFASLYGYHQVQWLHEPSQFWFTFDRLMDEVERNGLYAILCLGAEQWHLVANELTRKNMTPEGLNDLILRPTSRSRALAVRYFAEVVRRYADRPSVLFWEVRVGSVCSVGND